MAQSEKKLVRTFTPLAGGLMSIKTFGEGGRLMSERIVPEEEGQQIQQGHRPPEPSPFRRLRRFAD